MSACMAVCMCVQYVYTHIHAYMRVHIRTDLSELDTSPSTRKLKVLLSNELGVAGPITHTTDVSEVHVDESQLSAPRPFTHARGDMFLVPKFLPLIVMTASLSASTSRGSTDVICMCAYMYVCMYICMYVSSSEIFAFDSDH
jgi:hypothetical protein